MSKEQFNCNNIYSIQTPSVKLKHQCTKTKIASYLRKGMYRIEITHIYIQQLDKFVSNDN